MIIRMIHTTCGYNGCVVMPLPCSCPDCGELLHLGNVVFERTDYND